MYLHALVYIFQEGNALGMTYTSNDWVDVGDLQNFTCFLYPAQCTEGFTLTFWLKVKNGPNYPTLLSTTGASNDQGIVISEAYLAGLGYELR